MSTDVNPMALSRRKLLLLIRIEQAMTIDTEGKNNLFRSKRNIMPITDAAKKQIAQQRRLFFKVCFKCGGRNPISASRCRKCRGSQLRLKNRTLGAKK
jgi:large subunit ribosomal protein L40e